MNAFGDGVRPRFAESVRVLLADGWVVVIRAISGRDADEVLSLHGRSSEHDRELRFLIPAHGCWTPSPDLAAAAVPEAVEECGREGIPAVVVSAGLSATGLAARMLASVRDVLGGSKLCRRGQHGPGRMHECHIYPRGYPSRPVPAPAACLTREEEVLRPGFIAPLVE